MFAKKLENRLFSENVVIGQFSFKYPCFECPLCNRLYLIYYFVFSLAVYHKISTYEFIVSSREQRSEASDVEAGTDKPSSCKQSNKKMFKVGLLQTDFEFVSPLTKDTMCHRPSRDN